MGPNTQTQGAKGKIITSISLKPKTPDMARILIVHEDDLIAERLNIVLREAGYISERAKNITAGCESARSGRFQVVITTPRLGDGSWRRLVDIARHYVLGFVVVLLSSTFDFNEWVEALEDGAFDVLVACRRVTITRLLASKLLWLPAVKSCSRDNSIPI